MKRIGIMFVVLLFCCVAVSIRAAENNTIKKQADTRPIAKQLEDIALVSHFNFEDRYSVLNNYGAWDKDPNDPTQTCTIELVEDETRDKGDSVLKIDYDVDSEKEAYNGVWFALQKTNLEDYKYLVFWLKGDKDKGFTRNFKLEIKTNTREMSSYLVSKITDSWQQYIIPLADFRTIEDWKEVNQLTIVFEDWKASNKKGCIYLDDVYFTKGAIIEKSLAQIYLGRGMPNIDKMSDEEFLLLLENQAFKYFWTQTSSQTGLTLDKANNYKKVRSKIASTAAVGFALTAYPLAVERGWLPQEYAQMRTLQTLDFFLNKMVNNHGFFYHFVNVYNGKRIGDCEISSIDTALFLAGALFAGEYFGGEIKQKASELYNRVDWNWMMNGGETLSMGWKPEEGFLKERWNWYSECLIMYLLAIASPTHPIEVNVWDKIKRPKREYAGYTSIACGPLFTHQYSHIWVDFRNKHDKWADYFQSSKNATLANREFCINNNSKYANFSRNCWGLTACESPNGYDAYGSLPGNIHCDGTIAFAAAGGSIAFEPYACIAALRFMYNEYKGKVWGKYGFTDSFNQTKNWYSENVFAINQGPIMLMAENHLTGFVWKYFMQNNYIKKAMDLVGFEEGTMPFSPEPRLEITAKYGAIDLEFVDGEVMTDFSTLTSDNIELGSTSTSEDDLGARYMFKWDENNLYLWITVTDNSVMGTEKGADIYKQDCVELYINPKNNLLKWGDEANYQFGFAPINIEGKSDKYAWFQKKDFKEIKMVTKLTEKGYQIKAKIPFSIMQIKPNKNLELALSIAVNDLDDVSVDETVQGKYISHCVSKYKKLEVVGLELGKLKLVQETGALGKGILKEEKQISPVQEKETAKKSKGWFSSIFK